jgi:hypothetical protein
MRDGQLLDPQEIDKMYVSYLHFCAREIEFERYAAAIYQLLLYKDGMTSYVRYVCTSARIVFEIFRSLIMMPIQTLADECMGIEAGVARDYVAHRSGCRALLS